MVESAEEDREVDGDRGGHEAARDRPERVQRRVPVAGVALVVLVERWQRRLEDVVTRGVEHGRRRGSCGCWPMAQLRPGQRGPANVESWTSRPRQPYVGSRHRRDVRVSQPCAERRDGEAHAVRSKARPPQKCVPEAHRCSPHVRCDRGDQQQHGDREALQDVRAPSEVALDALRPRLRPTSRGVRRLRPTALDVCCAARGEPPRPFGTMSAREIPDRRESLARDDPQHRHERSQADEADQDHQRGRPVRGLTARDEVRGEPRTCRGRSRRSEGGEDEGFDGHVQGFRVLGSFEGTKKPRRSASRTGR